MAVICNSYVSVIDQLEWSMAINGLINGWEWPTSPGSGTSTSASLVHRVSVLIVGTVYQSILRGYGTSPGIDSTTCTAGCFSHSPGLAFPRKISCQWWIIMCFLCMGVSCVWCFLRTVFHCMKCHDSVHGCWGVWVGVSCLNFLCVILDLFLAPGKILR